MITMKLQTIYCSSLSLISLLCVFRTLNNQLSVSTQDKIKIFEACKTRHMRIMTFLLELLSDWIAGLVNLCHANYLFSVQIYLWLEKDLMVPLIQHAIMFCRLNLHAHVNGLIKHVPFDRILLSTKKKSYTMKEIN